MKSFGQLMESSARTAARFFARRDERRRQERAAADKAARHTLAAARRIWFNDDTTCLREIMLAEVGRMPRGSGQIFELVRDNFGTVGVRRLWRTLAWLIRTGKVERYEGGYRRPARTSVQQRRAS